MKKTYQIPFDKDGNQLSYEGYGAMQYLDNFEFVDTLEYVSYRTGRSAIGFTFRRASSGTLVNIFITDMDKMLLKMVEGKITGKFTFCKRGANYGCKLLETGSYNKDIKRFVAYNQRFDAYYDLTTGEWMSDACKDPACYYCNNRPEKV